MAEPTPAGAPAGAPVVLHVYDLGNSAGIQHINKVTYAIGGGLYHTAVEVYGKEYSFGYAESGSGVFGCQPKMCNLHQYKQAVDLGHTPMDAEEVKQVLRKLALDYQAQSYDLLNRNCHTFCNEFALALGVNGLPGWITRFPKIGSTTVAAVNATRDKVREVDQQFELSQKAETVKHNVASGLTTLWSKTQEGIAVAAEKTKEFEAKHDIRNRAMLGAFKGMSFVNRSFDKLCGNPDFGEDGTAGAAAARRPRAPSQGSEEHNPLMEPDVAKGGGGSDGSASTGGGAGTGAAGAAAAAAAASADAPSGPTPL